MRRRREFVSLLALTSLAGISSAAFTPQPIALPQLDFDRLGDVLLAGDFSGISLLDYTGRETVLVAPTERDNIVAQTSNDTYVSSDFADGAISASCLLGDNKTVIIAGNFSKVLNTTSNGLARLDLSTMEAASLGGTQSISGTVNALWCNDTEVYAGGSFTYEGSHGVAVWNSLNDTWSKPLFSGFVQGSSVNAIVPFGDNVVFGGTIKGILPSVRDNSSSGNNTDLLTPGMQPVSLNFANATVFGVAGASGQDASDLLCPYSNFSTGWTADLDSTTGYVNVTLGIGSVLPTRMRLFNLPDGSGTKSFRLVTEPANGIMNLSYSDASGEIQTCSANCPLPESNDTVNSHDFEFVNVVPTTSLRIELLDYYGSRAGLKGVQLFQQGQFAYANESFNLPRACGNLARNDDSQGSQSTATTDLEGSWTSVSDYMAANITDKANFGSTLARLYPTFNDYTVDRGRYAIQLWTPGCLQDNVCAQRGQVNVSVYPGFGTPQSTILYQTNNFDKYDVVYNGTLQDGAYIQISPTTQNALPMQVVAYKASLIYVGSPSGLNVSTLFEYSPANFSSNSSEPVGSTAVNLLGRQLGSKATVTTLLMNSSFNLLVGGSNFPSNLSANLVSLSVALGPPNITGEVSGLSSNESISKLYSANGSILALSSSDTYNVTGNLSAVSLGIGASSEVATFNLNGTTYLAFSHQSSGSGMVSLWQPGVGFVPREVAGRVNGHLDATYDFGNETVYFGSLEIVDAVSPGGAALISSANPQQPATLPFGFETSSNQDDGLQAERQMKRDTASYMDVFNASHEISSVYTGVYVNSSHAVIAGHFNATVTNNETATNVLMLNGNAASALQLPSSASVDVNSSFYAATSLNETVALGGNVSGSINGRSIRGLLLYNTSSSAPLTDQAPELSSNALVSVVAFKPNTSELIVGGHFSDANNTANSSCDGICGYDLERKSWFGPKSLDLGTNATVADLVFETGSRLLIGGNFTVKNSNVQAAVYDFSNNTLETLGSLPGPVSSVLVLSNSTTDPRYAVSGLSTANGQTSPYIRWYNGTNGTWNEFPGLELGAGSTVSRIALVMLNSSTNSTGGPLTGQQALFVSGKLMLSNDSYASVALYDGALLLPLYATTTNLEGLGPDISNGHGLLSTVISQYGGNLKGGVDFSVGTSTSVPRPSQSPGSPRPSETPAHNHRHHLMPVGHVVGIACGIGIGCVMLLTLLYLLVEFLFSLGDARVPYQNLAQTRPATDPMAGTKVL